LPEKEKTDTVPALKTPPVALYTNPFAAIRNAFSNPTMMLLGIVVFFRWRLHVQFFGSEQADFVFCLFLFFFF
jgi:hypothetical protein